MQTSKKLYTTLIIAILTVSILTAAIPMVSAEISAPPTLDVSTGPVGTKVTVTGAAGTASPFSTVTAYWDALAGQVLGSTSALSTGAYEMKVTIPPGVNGEHFIVVNDGETESAGASFIVTASLIVAPTAGLPGDTLAVTGRGFAASSDITLTFDSTTLTTPVSITLTAPAITTNSTGSFSASIVIPTTITPADFDDYTLTAEDEDTNTASATVTIDYNIKVTPALGPTGITMTISGRVEASVAYDITFNAAPIASGTTSSDGSFSDTYTVPGVLSTGFYPVTIVWETVNSRSATFEVTPSPTIALSVSTGVAGDVVTITGSGFSAKANITLYFGTTVVNSTAMDEDFGPTTAAGALPAGLEFVVPTLTPAVYAVKIVDQYGASSSVVYFTITATPVTTINLMGTMYYPGDTISFLIFTTDGFTAGPDVTIRDPTGATWWTGTWPLTASGPAWSVLYQDQLFGVDEHAMLPADAPIGTWNWTIAYTGSTAGAKTVTGLFDVNPKPSMDMIMDELTVFLEDLNASIIAIDDAIASIEIPELGTITASLSSLDSKITSISGDMATVETSLGTVQTTVESLDVVVGSLYGDVVTLQTAVGDVQTSVDNLDATVTSIEDGVATIDTNFGTLEGTITDMEGNLATVQTDVGTLKVDVADVKTNLGSVKTTVDDSLPVTVDMMPVWIAVILSLIAAIAAIFAVITIRQKIAG